MKILTIVGARPQFIKAAAVSRLIGASPKLEETLVHTGQHFDENMSRSFFKQLKIPEPKYNLGISGLTHGVMTGRMIEKLESLILDERPDITLLYGDTNSTLAGAMASSKLGIAIAHVEAGLRSNNMAMPEEINRIISDRLSALLFCPTSSSLKNLTREGYPHMLSGSDHQSIYNIGDVMLDSAIYYKEDIVNSIDLRQFGVIDKDFAIFTVHRQENVENASILTSIIEALSEVSKDIPIVWPLHPRTRAKLNDMNYLSVCRGITCVEPLPYFEMQRLIMSAKIVLTDSGGLQKEAYFHNVPCVTLRNETEWPETLAGGCNILAGTNTAEIVRVVRYALAADRINPDHTQFGGGNAAEALIEILERLA